MVMLVWVIAQAAIFANYIMFFKFLTWWTVFITLYAIWLSHCAANDFEFEKRPSDMALHHLLYTASIILNFIVTTIYWPLLHHLCLEEHAGDEMWIFSSCYCNHSVPIVMCLGNALVTNCVLSSHLLIPFNIIGFFYAFINFC